jgi:5,10-methylenetetrahydromethanopterin reductase
MEIGHLTWAPTLEGPALAQEDERFGFDIRYFGDNTCMHDDVFSELRDAARATTKIKLGTSVTNTLTRHPSAVATAIAGVQVVSGNRVICGVGKGDSAVAVIGEQPQRHKPFLERTAMLRAYLQGETIAIGEAESRLEWLERFDYTPVPLEIVATGPRMLRAAAALADRITINVGAAPERISWALEQVDAGLEEAGRTRADVTIGTFVMAAVDDDREAALDRLRLRVAPMAHMASVKGVDLSAQPEQLRRVTERLRDEYDYRGHVRGTTFTDSDFGNASPIDREFADWYGLAGDGASIRGRLDELEASWDLQYVFFAALERAERERMVGTVLPDQPASV